MCGTPYYVWVLQVTMLLTVMGVTPYRVWVLQAPTVTVSERGSLLYRVPSSYYYCLLLLDMR